jgi:DNA-binding response OmpR family regulator
MPEKILVVDDEQSLRDTLEYNLKKQGYLVELVADGISALEKARQFQPDVIILDIMLPGMDGFEVCRAIRKEMTTPILMLTARDDEIDRVVGLEVGADDYLTKPFSMRELIARVKAQSRRVKLIRDEISAANVIASSQQIKTFGNLTLNLGRREAQLEGKVLELQPKEYDLLAFFAEHVGQMLTREKILQEVWGWDYFGDSRTVDVHVYWLREKIEPDPDKPTRIITGRGAGYRFEG